MAVSSMAEYRIEYSLQRAEEDDGEFAEPQRRNVECVSHNHEGESQEEQRRLQSPQDR